MKRYKLLKDLPTFKAGEKFFISESGNLIAGTPSNPKQITVETSYGLPMKIDLMAYAQETLEEFPNILTDWFEEIEETKTFFLICDIYCTALEDNTKSREDWQIKNLKSIGNFFETREEAEKYLEFLKARTIIKQDAKGFKPDWNNGDEAKFFGYWDFIFEEPGCGLDYRAKTPNVYFQSSKDIKESFKKHPEEWRIYLTYEG